MRGLHTFINHFRYAKQSTTLVAFAFGLVMLFLSGMSILNQQDTQAASNSDNDIVRNGIYDRNRLAATCHGDVETIMKHYWIDCNLNGAVDGRACRDGNVYVGDRVVARNSSSIGRLPIMGSHPISIGGKTYYETANRDAFLSECLNAYVKLDQFGSFQYAILKDCGNPIWTPNPVVVPPPPVIIQVCDLRTKKIVSIKENEFNGTIHSKNLADCNDKLIQVCYLATKQIVTIKEKDFNATKHSKNLDDCKVVKIQVCNLATKQIITIDEKNFDASKHSKNLDDCKVVKIQVCDLTTKQVITINEDDFSPTKHSKNLDDCKIKTTKVCDTLTKQIVIVTGDDYDHERYSTNLADCETREIVVCDTNSGAIVTIDEKDADKPYYSTDLSDCDENYISVCELLTKNIISIEQGDFDKKIHSKNHADCKQVEGCVENPKAGILCELPKTGAETFLSGGLGLASMAFAGTHYMNSRNFASQLRNKRK